MTTVVPKPKSFLPRKLLIAALGVATINYVGVVACGGITDGSDKQHPPTSGNLPAPYDSGPPPTSGNLPAPRPFDASVDAADAADGGDANDDGGDGG